MGKCYLKQYLCFLLLFTMGCTFYGGKRPEAPRPAPPLPEKDYQVGIQERAQQARLRQEIEQWERLLAAIIEPLQAEIAENESIIEQGLFPQNQVDIAKKNRRLSSYLQALQRIEGLKRKLIEGDTALSRERVYEEMIDHYLACLKLVEATRDKEYGYQEDIERVTEEIAYSYQNDNYYAVVRLYNRLANSKRGESIDVESRVYCALSLARLGLANDAVRIVEEALQRDFSLTCGNAPLFYELGEWLIDGERYTLAQDIFRKVAAYYQTEEQWHERAKKKVALFQSDQQNLPVRSKIDRALDLLERNGVFSEAYLLCLEAQRSCTDLYCQQEVQIALDQLIVWALADIEEKLQIIETKIEESEYLEAQEILSTLQRSYSGEIYPLPIIKKQVLIRKQVERLQEKEAGWQEELERQKLERANELLESGQYEEAIVLFDQFKGTSYELEVETKRQLAIDRFAREQRVRAGQLFLKAKHSEDPELRKTYLTESYSLLKGTLDKYPDNSYAEKIKRNLEDVGSEIETLYPDFGAESELTDAESPFGAFEGNNTIYLERETP
jgi:hypothetical protein